MDAFFSAWKTLMSAGATLHGSFVGSGRSCALVVTAYPQLLDARETGVKAFRALWASEAWERFLAELSPFQPRADGVALLARLPAVTTTVPLPGPRALTLPLDALGKRRLATFLSSSLGERGFELRGRCYAEDSLSSVCERLRILEAEFPGSLTPAFAELVESFCGFVSELGLLCERGEKVSLGSWEESVCLTGEKIFARAPSLEEFQEALEDNLRSALAPGAMVVADLSCSRALHWATLLRELVFSCEFPSTRFWMRHWELAVARLVLVLTGERPNGLPVELVEAGLRSRRGGQGFSSYLTRFMESRPLTPHLALLIDSDPSAPSPLQDGMPCVRVHPTAYAPSFHMRPAAKKKSGPARNEIFPLERLRETAGANPFALQAEGGAMPGARYWMALDLFRLMQEFSHVFFNPTLLGKGFVVLAPEGFLAFREEWESRKDALKTGTFLRSGYFLNTLRSWERILPARPILAGEGPWSSSSRQWWDRDWVVGKGHSAGFLQVDWMDWVERPSIRIGVSWEVAADAPLRSLFEASMHALKSGAPLPPSFWGQGAAFDAPVFEPRPWFEVNGAEISPEEWASARKLKTGYLLRCGITVPSEDYEAHTERFVLRQKALARMGKVRLTEVWSRHLSASRGISWEKLNPAEYLSDLEFRLSPLLRDLDAALAQMAHGQVDRLALLGLRGELRPYQKEGVAVLWARTRLGLNVCLADEMGLGKTFQTIAFLLLVLEGKAQARVLVVVPKSVLPNWRRECARFAPQLSVGEWGEPGMPQVVLATYARVRLAADALAEETWEAVVLDEAHTIKNAETQVSLAVRRLEACRRIALTGTPVENSARELWNVMDWLNPGYLGRRHDFESYVHLARNFQEKMMTLRPLHAALEPVLLRRTKKDPAVALNLPDKIFEEHFYELSEEQEALYQGLVQSTLEDGEGMGSSLAARSLYLKALMHLKQVCDHPALFLGQNEDEWLDDAVQELGSTLSEKTLRRLARISERFQERKKRSTDVLSFHRERSAKLDAFVDLMDKVRAESVGVVIFSQFVGMGAILCHVLSLMDPEHWHSVPFLQGALTAPARMELVDGFQQECHKRALRGEGPPPIMVASLKAGGLGLNLTGADTVIHYDRWWNPAVEDQATDRLHRMGQKRTVAVHLFTGEATLEESISRILSEKRVLSQDLLGLGGAAAGGVAEAAGSPDSFRSLVDPKRRFS